MQKNHAKRTALALFLLFAVTVSAQAAKIAEVIPIGHTVGIKMQAEGVLIVQLTEVQGADGTHSPAKEAGVQEGAALERRSAEAGRALGGTADQADARARRRGEKRHGDAVQGQNRCVPHRRARARQSGRNRHADLR